MEKNLFENAYFGKAYKLRDIALVETVAIRNRGNNDFDDGYDIGDIIMDTAVDSFLQGYYYSKAKEGNNDKFGDFEK